MDNSVSYKIVIVGTEETGKTSYIYKFINNKFNEKYEPTLGADVYIIKFKTTYGTIILNCWDTAGKEDMGGLSDGYYIGADGCILVFDKRKFNSFRQAKVYANDIRKIANNVPIVIIANKSDLYNTNHIINNVNISTFSNSINAPYFDVSVKRDYNIMLPMTSLIRKLTGHNDLEIIELI